MTENTIEKASLPETAAPVIHVSPSPHLADQALTTQRIMLDVVIGLIPVALMALSVFRLYAVKQLAICIVSCLAAEALFARMRGRALPLKDCSALVTGIILALSLPGPAPWYVGVIASFVAIGIGKAIFGGIGMNIFNPAMVGRAFVMIAFASALAASGYQDVNSSVDAVTQATPLDTFKQTGAVAPLSALFFGLTNGSLGDGIHTAVDILVTGGRQGTRKGDHDKGPSYHGRVEDVHADPAKDGFTDPDSHEGGDHPHIPGRRPRKRKGQDDTGDQGRKILERQSPSAHLGEQRFGRQAADDTDRKLLDRVKAKHIQRHENDRREADNHVQHDALGGQGLVGQMRRGRHVDHGRRYLGWGCLFNGFFRHVFLIASF